jgi:hypothetical protein
LENSALVSQLGQWLDSPLLEVRPRTHLAWETLEFDPLVNPRAHRFGENPRLPLDVARQHYQARLDQLGWKPTLDATDLLDLTALLFLQDRTEEALAKFDLIDPTKLRGRLNYDYLHTVVLFQREDPLAAKALASQILPTLPPGLWHDRFQAVADQATEVAELTDPNKTDKLLADPEAPQLDLALAADGKLVITHRALEQTTLRLFNVDLEVLFSKNPFLRGDGSTGDQPEIQPNESLEITLAKGQRETSVSLPASLDKGNLLVSAAVGGQQLLRILDSKALELRHTPDTRTVQVLDAATSKPLPKTYVKVYAQTHSGEILFHKDGYTDLRGKFDYLSHTGIDPVTIKRLAILVSHPEKGARSVIYDR